MQLFVPDLIWKVKPIIHGCRLLQTSLWDHLTWIAAAGAAWCTAAEDP
jgi:hypothetical protein